MTEPQEPLLIHGMRRHPNGEVRFLPEGRAMSGTSTRGFLRELDNYVEQIEARATEKAFRKAQEAVEALEDRENDRDFEIGWINRGVSDAVAAIEALLPNGEIR